MNKPTFILPPDPWWLLRVTVDAGQQTPFHLWLLWRWQFFRIPPVLA